MLGEGLRLAAIGIGCGIAAAVTAGKVLTWILPELSAPHPVTVASIAVLGLCISLGASDVPARRAARVDPVVALRAE